MRKASLSDVLLTLLLQTSHAFTAGDSPEEQEEEKDDCFLTTAATNHSRLPNLRLFALEILSIFLTHIFRRPQKNKNSSFCSETKHWKKECEAVIPLSGLKTERIGGAEVQLRAYK